MQMNDMETLAQSAACAMQTMNMSNLQQAEMGSKSAYSIGRLVQSVVHCNLDNQQQ